jgi:hypothetical protein
MYIKLFKNIGLKLNPKQDLTVSAFSGKVLVRALSLGRFGSDDLATTMSTKYISEETVKPKQNSQEAGMLWKMVTNEGEDQFIFKKMAQAGPETVFATYFGYWVYSPVDLSDLLNSGPDLPQVTLQILVNSDAKVLMNGKPLKVTKADKVGVNKKIIINSIPLKQGWNQFLIKAVSDSFVQPNQGSIRVTMESNIKAFDEQLKTAIEN